MGGARRHDSVVSYDRRIAPSGVGSVWWAATTAALAVE
jgi:hypothetical protein